MDLFSAVVACINIGNKDITYRIAAIDIITHIHVNVSEGIIEENTSEP